MRQLFLAFIFICGLLGCRNHALVAVISHTSEQDSIKYRNLIMELVLMNHSLPCYDTRTFREGVEDETELPDSSSYRHKGYHLYQPYYIPFTTKYNHYQQGYGFWGYKEVKDTVIGIILRIHRWADYQPALPNTILYASNQKDFEYGFCFLDESRIRYDSYDTSLNNRSFEGRTDFQFQLNYLINEFNISSITKKELAKHFLYLVVDSLLMLKKITVKDTNELIKKRQYYLKPYDEGCSICTHDVNNELRNMLDDLKSGNKDVSCYLSSTSYYDGFWRFEIVAAKNKTFIKAAFHKFRCGKSFYL